MRSSSRIVVAASPVRCPYCHQDVHSEAESWRACESCLARHHAGCWDEARRCASCGRGVALAPRSPLPNVLVSLVVLVGLVSPFLACTAAYTAYRREVEDLHRREEAARAALRAEQARLDDERRQLLHEEERLRNYERHLSQVEGELAQQARGEGR